MYERVRAAIDRQHLIQEGEPLLIGVSGGPDSVSLLDLLVRFSRERDNKLVVCHFNHQLRGASSEDDARFVSGLADKYGLRREIRSGDVRVLARQEKLSLEDAARVMRFDFFRDVAHEMGIGKLALAHTADDQIETLLLRLMRGAGLRGLAAMQSERKMKGLVIVRPFLDFWKTEVRNYAEAQNLPYRTDLSNFDASFMRNRIRLELIPMLETEYSPAIKRILHRTAEITAEDDRFLDKVARGLYEQLIDGEALRIRQLVVHDIALQRRVIRHWLADLTVPIVPSFEQVEAICALTARAEGGFGCVDLPNGRIVCRDYDLLRITDPLVHRFLEIHHPLRIPGETVVPELELQVKTDVIEAHAGFALPHEQEKGVEYFDLEELGQTLALRTWRPGDRYQPIGLRGTKTLQDLFVDKKISLHDRHKVPLLVNDDGEICWVVGYRISESFKIKPSTRRVLRVHVAPLPLDNQLQAR